jgi:hypothetical protein
MLLTLLPAGGLGLTGWSAANLTPLASGLLALFCCWTRVIGRPPWWAWLGPLTVIAFWWLPQSPLFPLYLSGAVLLTAVALSRYRGRTDFRVGAFMLLSSMLLLLTTPGKAISLILLLSVLLSVLIAFTQTTALRAVAHEGHPDRGDLLVFAALFVIACRYALFDLFGNSDSSLLFGLQNLDIH